MNLFIKNKDLDILVAQIEIEFNKTIIYHKCNECHEPILITNLEGIMVNGDICRMCKQIYCTKQYICGSEYFKSCSYKCLSGFTEVYINSDDNSSEYTDGVCFNCIKDLVYKNDKNQFCKHILNSVMENKGGFRLAIVFNNENQKYNCDKCDAENNIIIQL